MATTDSIPIASFGGNEAVAKELKTLLLPEYDSKYRCSTPSPPISHSVPLSSSRHTSSLPPLPSLPFSFLPSFPFPFYPSQTKPSRQKPPTNRPPPVVHISLDLPTALSELPALCNGQLDTPSACSLGSNASQPDISQRRVPRAIVFGGSVTDEDYKAVVEAVNNRGGELPVIKMVRVTKGDVLGMGGKGPEPGVVAMAVRGRLVAEGVVRGERLN